MKNGRIKYIDAAKGIGICLVILGHLNIPLTLHSFIYSFHMPLFFILSGITFREESAKVFFKKRCFSILIPYLLFSFAIILKNVLKELIVTKSINLTEVLRYQLPAVFLAIQNGKYSAGSYWFLPCLFVCEALLFLIVKVFKNNPKAVLAVSVGISLCQYILDRAFNYSLPFCCDVAFVALAFVAFGYVFKEKLNGLFETENKKRLCLTALVLLIIGIAATVINGLLGGGSSEMSVGAYANWVSMIILGVLLSLLVFALSGLVPFRPLLYIGRNSLFFYLFHRFIVADTVVNALNAIITRVIKNAAAAEAVQTAVMLLLVIALCTVFSYPYNVVMSRLKKLYFKSKDE
ncbi:MAG: acyltransferase family protein [Eubacterium sp.]|nr:acyltransferase family protein [Eubacterium sp.]